MKLSLLLGIAATAGLCSAPALAQQASTTATPSTRGFAQPLTAPEGGVHAPNTGAPISGSAQAAPLTLRNGAVPTGLQGFYDYQSNGMLHGRIYVPKNDNQKIHTTYMLSLQGADSAVIASSRRVGYAYSNDGGQTWQSTREIDPGFRLGFPYMDVSADGIPYIAVHGDPDGAGARTMIYRGGSNSTSFTRIATLPRPSFTGASGDDGAGVIWPAFVIDPKDATKKVVVATLSPATTGGTDEPVHFIHNALASNGEWDVISAETIANSSGGRNILATSTAGKVGLAYYHSDAEGTSGVYFTESNDGGTTWGTPARVMANPLIDGEDSTHVGFNLDLVYNGEEPMIVSSGNVDGFYVSEGVWLWSPSKGFKRIVKQDSTLGLGVSRVIATSAQPNMANISYPGLSIGDDGRHVVVTFQAAAQPIIDVELVGDPIVSSFDFLYFRLWAIGSPDGGATWGQPRIIQDFAGAGDSASIEYPVPSTWGKVTNNNFEHQMTFHARREPGMYAFIVSDVSSAEGDQPASRGPFNDATGTFSETFQYYQKTMFDPPFFGEPSSVDGDNGFTSRMRIAGSYPNPASGAMTVEYQLATSGSVSLKIYDMLGVEVLAPVAGENGYAGEYKRSIDVASLPSGQYRMVLSQNGRTVSQPLNIVR